MAFHGLKRIRGAPPIDDGLLLGPEGPHLMEHEAAAQHAETWSLRDPRALTTSKTSS